MQSSLLIVHRLKVVCSVIFLFLTVSVCNGYTAQKNFKYVNTPRPFKLQSTPSSNTPDVKKDVVGGTVLITGLKNENEDNFLLDLINSQQRDKAEGNLWENIVITATNEAESSANLFKKRFLTRENKYSGLLDRLAIEPYVNVQDTPILTDFLFNMNANTWIAFNVAQAEVPQLSQAALDSGIKRLVVLMEIPLANQNTTSYPEFDAAEKAFAEAGAAFTGIRHGSIIDGHEDNPYEIVNGTTPLMCYEPIPLEREEMVVERGVLSRVVSEMLTIEDSFNNQCGVISAGKFAEAYLNILRGSGFTRQQEVRKIYQGGLARVARMTVKTYEKNRVLAEEDQARRARNAAREAEEKKAEAAKVALVPVSESGEPVDVSVEDLGVDFDDENDVEVTEAEVIETRSKEILQGVWREMNSRMYAKSTSKMTFFEKNQELAMAIAANETKAAKKTAEELQLEKEATMRMVDKIEEVGRKQYSKLLSLERTEMQNQKMISSTWVKYVYLLLSITTAHCVDKGMLFNNMDEYQQTLLLREKANELRSMVGLPPYPVIYDGLDASAIVEQVSTLQVDTAIKDMLSKDQDELTVALEAQYGKLLKSVSALRGTSQIVEVAIETLQKELPPMPPSVREMRGFESKTQQEMRRQMKLDATRNRGKTAAQMPVDSKVGKL